MRLIDDWHVVLRHSWAIRLSLLAALLQGLDSAVAVIGYAVPIPPWVVIAICLGAALSRLIPQKKISGGGDADQ
ncbi:hypothetical protein C3941_23770 [Kaistia algarum]|uniref:DUF7940 domain-containing protein n=1 Tax=Kaistia algarum TaxID=2083279 RepID=UPI000CE78479|nr:hypothetical protein [Kaistia algarum]MCX5513410.1 hypothetical protein [Kaistia algarum]PPE77417.1 hypothetical protein C3941_23770 [Kaistia algarum]